jgi:hypothetical protein
MKILAYLLSFFFPFIYIEKFDDGMPNILSRYTDVLNPEGMSLDSTDVPYKGMVALKMTNIGGINTGGHLFKQFNPGLTGTIYLRYYVKYPSSSKGYIHHESVWIGGYSPATPYPNPRAGVCGLGDKRFSIAYEPVNAPNMDTYLYWGDMKPGARGQCYGNDMINGHQTLEWDKWICIEMKIKLNDPVTSHNGELQIWHDGTLVGHWGPGYPRGYWNADSWINDPNDQPFEGFRWRTDDKLNLNYLWIEFFDDKTPVGESHYIKFADLMIINF